MRPGSLQPYGLLRSFQGFKIVVANPIWIAGGTAGRRLAARPRSGLWGMAAQLPVRRSLWIAGYGGTPASGASPVWVMRVRRDADWGRVSDLIGGYLTEGIGLLPGSLVNTVAPVASGSAHSGVDAFPHHRDMDELCPPAINHAWNGAGSPRNASTYVVARGRRREIDQRCTGYGGKRHWAGSIGGVECVAVDFGRPRQYCSRPVISGSLTVGSTP